MTIVQSIIDAYVKETCFACGHALNDHDEDETSTCIGDEPAWEWPEHCTCYATPGQLAVIHLALAPEVFIQLVQEGASRSHPPKETTP